MPEMKSSPWTDPSKDFLSFFELVVDIIFLLDVIVNFRTAYMQRVGANFRLESDSKKVAMHYATGFFLPDLLGSIPWDIFSSGARANVLWRLPKLFKLLRTMKILSLLGAMSVKHATAFGIIRDFFHPGVLKLLKVLFLTLLTSHIASCLFYLVGEQGAEEFSWISRMEVANSTTSRNLTSIKHASLSVKYLASVYWAFTTFTTIGYGDITPKTIPEIAYACLVMVVGATFFAWAVGNITSLLHFRHHMDVEFNELINRADEVMHTVKLPLDLRKKVRSFFEYSQSRRHAFSFFNATGILQDLPESLRAEITLALHSQWIENLKFFEGKEERFKAAVLMELQLLQFGPTDLIYEAGEEADSMYFVLHGKLEMKIPIDNSGAEQEERFLTIGEGAFFGEAAVLRAVPRRKRLVSVQALSWCDLFSLSRASLIKVVELFPSVNLEQFEDLGQQTNELMRMTSQGMIGTIGVQKASKKWQKASKKWQKASKKWLSKARSAKALRSASAHADHAHVNAPADGSVELETHEASVASGMRGSRRASMHASLVEHTVEQSMLPAGVGLLSGSEADTDGSKADMPVPGATPRLDVHGILKRPFRSADCGRKLDAA